MSVYNVDGNIICPADDTEDLEDLIPNRLLVWHDEFRGSKVDTDKWNHLYGRGSTSSYMQYSEDLDKITEVNGDGLAYRCIKDYPNVPLGINYNSTYLLTLGKFEFRYGRIEAKMRFPNVSPHHSTFWTLGSVVQRKSISQDVPWESNKGVLFPSCGEIDIAEYDNGSVGARTHWSSQGFDTEEYASGGNIASLVNTPYEWHIYSCEWTESAITFYVDGVQKGTWNTANGAVNGWNPFKIPHFLILNCIISLQGQQSWDIAQTDVAWVRVYAPAGVTEYIKETGISIDASASISVGQRKWLEPTFTPANPSDMTLNWLSHNENIVTCYGGMLIGVSAGTTYVQCTTKHGHTALCKVVVS